MNQLIIPSQTVWHLAWSDLFLLFHNLHTALCDRESIELVIFGGEDPVVCQNLQRVWQQLMEDLIENTVCLEDISPASLDQQLDIEQLGIIRHRKRSRVYETHHSNWDARRLYRSTSTVPTVASQTALSSSQSIYSKTSCNVCQQPAEHSLYLPGVEASVLLLTAHFYLWLQVQLLIEPKNAAHRASSSTAIAVEPGSPARWQVSLVLDDRILQDLLKTPAVDAIAGPVVRRIHQASRWHTAGQQFWHRFLQLTQKVSPSHPPVSRHLHHRHNSKLLKSILQHLPVGVFQANLDGSILQANPAFCQLTGYTNTQLRRLDLRSITAPEDFAAELEMIRQIVQFGEQRIFEKRYQQFNGDSVWAEVKLCLVGQPEDDDSYLLGFVTDLSDRKALEAERIHTIQDIQQRQERESLLNNIAARIRSSLDLATMLQSAAEELKQALRTDRVVVYQIFPDQSGSCVTEAVNPGFPVMQGQDFAADCIPPPYLDAYQSGRLWSVDDVSKADLTNCHQEMLRQVHVQSMIATGILSMDESLEPNKRKLWGLLVVHHCQAARHWSLEEQQLVEAVANQLAIALEQTKLLSHLTSYTQELEERVSQRTQSLERSLKFEQFIRNLADCLHRDLNENHLFKTVVSGLMTTLGADACIVSLYNPQQNSFEVKYEALSDAAPANTSFLGAHLSLHNLSPTQQQQLLTSQPCYFEGAIEHSLLFHLSQQSPAQIPTNLPHRLSELVSPIMGIDHLVGMLLVLQFQPCQFEPAVIKLVQQTTSYCAIALRQAHLYRREHEQRVSAEYLRSFLEKSIDIFVEYDAQLRYTSINPAGCIFLERAYDEVIGKTNRELLGANAESLEQLVRQAFETAEKVFVDHEIVLPEGSRVFETIYAPITDPTGVVHRVIGVCRDITEFKQQWQLLESQNHQLAETTRLKQEFVATTSHELRTPLTAILGFSNVLLQEFFGELNPKQKDYIERIYNSGQHLLDLINDILDLSRLEAGRMELDLQAVYLGDICEGVISLIQERATQQGLNLEVDMDPHVEWIVADPRRLKQMLLNLLSNAVKFTAQGTVGLKIYCQPSSPANSLACSAFAVGCDWVHFQIWDTGIGISEVDQRSLFSPFSQIDSSLARKNHGTGLGLVITRKLAELHGGWVTLESTPGEGSKFTISLPLETDCKSR